MDGIARLALFFFCAMVVPLIDIARLHARMNTRLPISQISRLPAEVVAGASNGEVRVRFMWIGETVADHIEKLVFRRHRRKIAGARQHRA